jgi:hypothetical protein
MVNKYYVWVDQINAQVLEVKANNMEDAHEEAARQWKKDNNPTFSDTQLVKDSEEKCTRCGKKESEHFPTYWKPEEKIVHFCHENQCYSTDRFALNTKEVKE